MLNRALLRPRTLKGRRAGLFFNARRAGDAENDFLSVLDGSGDLDGVASLEVEAEEEEVLRLTGESRLLLLLRASRNCRAAACLACVRCSFDRARAALSRIQRSWSACSAALMSRGERAADLSATFRGVSRMRFHSLRLALMHVIAGVKLSSRMLFSSLYLQIATSEHVSADARSTIWRTHAHIYAIQNVARR